MKPLNVYHITPSNQHWPLALIVLASCSWAHVTLAQDPATTASPGGADASAVPASGDVKKAAKPKADTTAESAQPAVEKPRNPFRTGESTGGRGTAKRSPFSADSGDTDAPKTKTRKTGYPNAEEAAEKAAAESSRPEEAESRFIAPGFYGRAPSVVTPGRGEYARPKFRYGVSVGVGYDDNPDQVSKVSLSSVARPRSRSGFTWVNGHWDAQWIKPSTVFTVNAEVGGNFYWNRPGASSDFNGRVGMMFIKRINPRTQFSANASLAYLSQPDYANYYASTSQVGGDYFTGSAKFDLSHRWAPRFTTVTSASVNLLKYASESAASGTNSYWNFIFGNEFRFQASPRHTWVVEGRYGFDEYLRSSTLNSQTAYLLGGLDWIASRNLTANFRTGASFRSYDAGGDATAPYAEFALNYRAGRHSTFSLNGRYGFEQSSVAGDENLSYRFGLLYQHAFTSRFSGNAGFNVVNTNYNPRTGANSSSNVYDANVGLQYRIDRHFSLGARYNYTFQNTSTGAQDYDRNRVLFTVQYEY